MQPSISFSDSVAELSHVLSLSINLSDKIHEAGTAIINSIKKGGKLLTCGNGGSAADALHLSEELVGRFKIERRGLPAICLNSDVTALTCIGNDYGYELIYSRQIEALGKSNDILVGFSTSGNSPNILHAFLTAKKTGIKTVFLGGKNGGSIQGKCDHEIIVPSNTTARIQEVHTLILHQWLEEIDITDWNSL